MDETTPFLYAKELPLISNEGGWLLKKGFHFAKRFLHNRSLVRENFAVTLMNDRAGKLFHYRRGNAKFISNFFY